MFRASATRAWRIVIAGADCDFKPTEQAVAREACCALDLPPHEFDP